jgi:hypothetical protein
VNELQERIIELAGDIGGELAYPPDAIAQVAEAIVDEVARGRAEHAVGALLEVAMFLDTQKGAPDAARELAGMAQRLAALVHDASADPSTADTSRAAAARAIGAADGSARPLASSARPEGATAASPLARFLLQKNDDDSGA